MSEDLRKARFRVSDATIESPDWMRVVEQPDPAFARPGPTGRKPVEHNPDSPEAPPESQAMRSIVERHKSARSGKSERPPGITSDQPPITISEAPPGMPGANVAEHGTEEVLVNEKIRNLQMDLEERTRELEQCRAELEAASNTYGESCQQMALQRAEMFSQAEQQLLSLSVTVAEAILDGELRSHPELHQELARQAICELGDPKNTTLRASREAYAAILSHQGEPVVEIDGLRIEVTLDPAIEGIGCVASTPDAQVDGRLSERLRAVANAFRERLAEEQGGEG